MSNCEERAGFLFSHACQELSTDQCGDCQKAICQTHSHSAQGRLICTTCAKQENKRSSRLETDQPRSARGSSTPYWNSPFFYDGYYHGYGRYHSGYWGSGHLGRDDFTEADAHSLSDGGGEGFEQDLGGS